MKQIISLVIVLLIVSCQSTAQKKEKKAVFKITKTDTEWKQILTPLQYRVLRKADTEPPFSSPLNKVYTKGVFVCAACNTPLFKSKHKFDSGTGWPSFDREIKDNVVFSTDNDLGYTRIEEHCAGCGGHLGHVFDDGPKETTGKRHCINGAALKFIPEN